jgi:indole-3-glycerol phosphate synthase
MIAASGLETGQDLHTLHRAGYQGFLVGTALMQTPNPGIALKQLLQEMYNAH